MSTEVPTSVQHTVLTEDLQLWLNTRFLWENRLESNARLQKLELPTAYDPADITKHLEMCQAQISFYQSKLDALPPEADPAKVPNGKAHELA